MASEIKQTRITDLRAEHRHLIPAEGTVVRVSLLNGPESHGNASGKKPESANGARAAFENRPHRARRTLAIAPVTSARRRPDCFAARRA